MLRDKEVNIQLSSEGWTIFRFWGKKVTKNAEYYAKKIQEAVYEKQKNF